MNQFAGKVFLRSTYGNMSAEGGMSLGKGEGREQYAATVSTSGFDLGRLLKQVDTLVRVRFQAYVVGKGPILESADARVDGMMEELTYHGSLEEHTSELQFLKRTSYPVICFNKIRSRT